jgi:hypothetical protein
MKIEVEPIQETSSASNISETTDNVQREGDKVNVGIYEETIFMKL